MMKTKILGALAAVTLAACAAQTDATYEGDTLATVHGTISNGRSGTVESADLVLFWYGSLPIQIDKAETIGEFPSRFHIPIRDQPQRASQIQNDLIDLETGEIVSPALPYRFNKAAVMAVRDADEFIANPNKSQILGFGDYLIYYLADDVPEDVEFRDTTVPGRAKGYYLTRSGMHQPIEHPLQLQMLDEPLSPDGGLSIPGGG